MSKVGYVVIKSSHQLNTIACCVTHYLSKYAEGEGDIPKVITHSWWIMANPFGRENQDAREERRNPHGNEHKQPHGKLPANTRPHNRGDTYQPENESEAFNDETTEAYSGAVRSRILNPRAFSPVIAQARRRVPGTIQDEDWRFAPAGSHMSRWALEPLPGGVADLHVRFKTQEGGETRTYVYHYYDLETASYIDNLLGQVHHPHGQVLYPLVILSGVPFS